MNHKVTKTVQVRDAGDRENSADSAQEDIRRFRELRKTKDTQLRDALVLKYQGLAEKIARRYASSGEPIEDLIQEGYLGLIKAVDRFNPDQGVQFNTYATHTISGEIRHYLRDLSKLIQEPGWHAQLRFRVLKCADQLQQKMGRAADAAEIAEALDMKEPTVRAVLESGQVFQLDSLDAPDDEEFEDAPSKLDRLEAPGAFRDGGVENRLALQQALRKLKRLERTVIYAFFYQEYSKTEIARKLGISVNYASYLVKRGLRNLKNVLLRTDEIEASLRLQQDQLSSLEARLQVATADVETGLASQSQFAARLQHEIARANRYHLEFSVLVFDVELSKRAADSKPRVLAAVTKILRQESREVDLLSRYAELTFAALLPHTGTRGQVVGERVLRKASTDDNLRDAQVAYRIVTYPHDLKSPDAIIDWIANP